MKRERLSKALYTNKASNPIATFQPLSIACKSGRCASSLNILSTNGRLYTAAMSRMHILWLDPALRPARGHLSFLNHRDMRIAQDHREVKAACKSISQPGYNAARWDSGNYLGV